jgi:hypothetical protein
MEEEKLLKRRTYPKIQPLVCSNCTFIHDDAQLFYDESQKEG